MQKKPDSDRRETQAFSSEIMKKTPFRLGVNTALSSKPYFFASHHREMEIRVIEIFSNRL